MARKINAIDHDLTTALDLVGPRARPERDRVHTLHSALAVLRSWVAPGAEPGYLTVRLDGRVYRLEVAGPSPVELRGEDAQRRTLRVDCRAVRAAKGRETGPPLVPTHISLWFSTDPARVPLRIDVDDDGARAHALLIERDVVAEH